MAFDLTTSLGGGGGGPVNAGYTINDLYTVTRGAGGFQTGANGVTYSDGDTLFFNYYNSGWSVFGSGLSTVQIMTSYTTVVDITSGSGTFLFCLTGYPQGNAALVTFRITIDGTARTLQAYINNGWRALCLADELSWLNGNAWDRIPPQNNTSDVTTPTPIPRLNIWVPGPNSGRDKGVRFESSCKVEVLSTSGWAPNDPGRWTLAAVFLDQ